MLSRCFLGFSVGIGAFVIGLSQIFSFFSFAPQAEQAKSLTTTPTLLPLCHFEIVGETVELPIPTPF